VRTRQSPDREAAVQEKGVHFEVGGSRYEARRWRGQALLPAGGYLAIAAGSEADGGRLELLAAFPGGGSVHLVEPDDVARFVVLHRRLRIVGHGVAGDFWAVQSLLRGRNEAEAERLWWELADGNRLHDVMLLDALVRLAESDASPDGRSLAEVAHDYAGLDLGRCKAHAGDGMIGVAAAAAVAVLATYPLIRKRALQLLLRLGKLQDVRDDAREKFGLLSEGGQVKKSIALARVTSDGIALDPGAAAAVGAGLRAEALRAAAEAQALAPVYRTDGRGELVLHGRARAPEVEVEALRRVLETIRAEFGEALPPALRQKKPAPPSAKEWARHAELHPFVQAWVRAEALAGQLRSLAALVGDAAGMETLDGGLVLVHPIYNVLTRTGRTSCRGPNLQSVPRDGPFRGLFRARPGHLLLTTDYTCCELRTLAAVTLHRYGQSHLADVLRRGADPHCHTAAMLLGVPTGEFSAWRDSPDLERRRAYARARQGAKAVSFGVAAGMGPDGLAEYARDSYGIDLTTADARRLRDKLTKEIYPELVRYLADVQPNGAVATMTGRVRGRVGRCQALITPTQGLAADGAGLALFGLVKEGVRVVGHVHDEFLLELPDEGGYVSEEKVRRVEEILCREMEKVLVGGVPAACESALSLRWGKGAGMTVRDGKAYPGEPASAGTCGRAQEPAVRGVEGRPTG
jgi:hypothetical protein